VPAPLLAACETAPVTGRQQLMLVSESEERQMGERAYSQLLDGGHTTAQLARRVGVPAARIKARLNLLRLDEQVQWMFHRGDLPLTLAPVLLRVADPLRQRQIATMAARRQLSVLEIERIVERGAGALQAPPPKHRPRYDVTEARMARHALGRGWP